MLDKMLSYEVDNALAMEEYYRTKLLYWKHKRRELEAQIESESTDLLNEFEQLADEAWDNDAQFSGNQAGL